MTLTDLPSSIPMMALLHESTLVNLMHGVLSFKQMLQDQTILVVVETDRQSINGGSLLPDYKIFLSAPDVKNFP